MPDHRRVDLLDHLAGGRRTSALPIRGLVQRAAVGQGDVGVGQLQRRGGDVALADRGDGRLAGLPLPPALAVLPFDLLRRSCRTACRSCTSSGRCGHCPSTGCTATAGWGWCRWTPRAGRRRWSCRSPSPAPSSARELGAGLEAVAAGAATSISSWDFAWRVAEIEGVVVALHRAVDRPRRPRAPARAAGAADARAAGAGGRSSIHRRPMSSRDPSRTP